MFVGLYYSDKYVVKATSSSDILFDVIIISLSPYRNGMPYLVIVKYIWFNHHFLSSIWYPHHPRTHIKFFDQISTSLAVDKRVQFTYVLIVSTGVTHQRKTSRSAIPCGFNVFHSTFIWQGQIYVLILTPIAENELLLEKEFSCKSFTTHWQPQHSDMELKQPAKPDLIWFCLPFGFCTTPSVSFAIFIYVYSTHICMKIHLNTHIRIQQRHTD